MIAPFLAPGIARDTVPSASAYDAMHEAAEALKVKLEGRLPKAILVTGSGLGPVADAITDAITIPYTDIPHFPRPTVQGHPGKLKAGMLGSTPVACMIGRVHVYEGNGVQPFANALRALKLIGAELLLLTAAAGSLREEAGPGSLMAVTDHLNLTGQNPLLGLNDDRIGPRFPAMANAWDADEVKKLHAAAKAEGITLHEGVYAGVLGPNIETAAEVRMLRTLGGDMVGMSMVPECLLARHCGLNVAGVGVMVNLAEGLSKEPISHDLVVTMAERTAPTLAKLLKRYFTR